MTTMRMTMLSCRNQYILRFLSRRRVLLLSVVLLASLFCSGASYTTPLQPEQEEEEEVRQQEQQEQNGFPKTTGVAKRRLPANAGEAITHSARRLVNCNASAAEEISFTSVIQIQLSPGETLVSPAASSHTTTTNHTTTTTTDHTTNVVHPLLQLFEDNDTVIIDSFIATYNDYNFTTALCTAEEGGTVIDAARVLPSCGSSSSSSSKDDDILSVWLEVNATTTCFGAAGCLDEQDTTIDNPALRLFKNSTSDEDSFPPSPSPSPSYNANTNGTARRSLSSLDSAATRENKTKGILPTNNPLTKKHRSLQSNPEDRPSSLSPLGGNGTSHMSPFCFCDPPSADSFSVAFQQMLLLELQTTLPPPGHILNTSASSNSSFSPFLLTLPPRLMVSITELDDTDCEPSPATRDSREVTIVLYFDRPIYPNAGLDSSFQLPPLLEQYIIKAYAASNRLHGDLCDPWDRKIDSVDAQVVHDLDDIVYPVGRAVQGNPSSEGGGGSINDHNRTAGVLLQATLSYLVGSRTEDGNPFSSPLNAFEDSPTTVAHNTSSTRITDGLESDLPQSCLHQSDANATYYLRGPTPEEFDQQLVLTLMEDDMNLDMDVWHDISVHEVFEVPCASTASIADGDTSPPLTNITEVVLVDFNMVCSLVDDDLAFLADQLVGVYNTLNQENYCDPNFRQISSAKVLRRGETRLREDTSSVLTIEIELVGTCIGCDPTIDGFYDVPGTVIPSNNTAIRINEAINTEVNPILAMNNTNNTDVGNTTNNNTTRHQRSLGGRRLRNSTHQNSVCYCPVDAVAARAPSEAEVMDVFRTWVQQGFQSTLRCVSSVGECQFGTRFESSFLVAFRESSATATNFTIDIEVAWQNTLNGLFFVSRPGVCQPDFRLVQSVSTTVVTGLTDEDVRRHLGTSSNSRRTQDGIPEEVETTTSSSPVPSTSTAPSMTSTPTLASFPTSNPSTSARPALDPTLSPTIDVFESSVFVLLQVSGICNGCNNDFLAQNEISAIVSRKLKDEPDPYHLFSRSLQTTGNVPDSTCFCPIESVVEETAPSADAVLDAYQDQLENSDIPLDVRSIQEVQVVDCQDEIEEFETHVVLRFSLDAEAVTNRGLVLVAEIIQETYNELTDQEYCDPLIRRIEDLEFVSMEKLEDGLNGCDLVELTFDIIGRCRGCEDDSPLFDDPGEDDNVRRLMEQDNIGSVKNVNNVDLELLGSRRRLQGSEVCLCERNTRADRAPSLEEFEDYLSPKIERKKIGSVCGLTDQFEQIQITDTPSSPPSSIPSDSPSACTVSLENEFVTEIVLFVDDGSQLDAEAVDQLGQALETAYNDLITLQYGECEPLYRIVTSVTPIDNMPGRSQRQLSLRSILEGAEHKGESSNPNHFAKKYTQSSSRNGRRVQESRSGDPVRYMVTGRCAGCSSDSNLLDAMASAEVIPRMREFVAPFLDGGQLLDMAETDEISCSDVIVDFDEVVIVELVPSCPEEENFGFNEDLLVGIEETFVSTYNQVATLYCDEFFRILVDAKVENLGTITEEGNVPIEIRAFAQCLGCDPDEVGIYGNPSSLQSDKSGVVDGNFNRALQFVSGGRLLQNMDSCVCSAQALANRSPSESEFINAFRQSIETSPLDCVASVGECQFGSTFDTDIVISFEGNQTSLTDDVRRTIQESFQALLNDLYEPSKDVCDPSFRVVLDVEVIFDFTLNGEVIESSANSTTDDGSSGRYLGSPDQQKHRQDQGSTTANVNPLVPSSLGPATAPGATPNQPPTAKQSILPSSAPTVDLALDPNESPTASPTIDVDSNLVRSLLTVSGVCNGCLNELFLSNQLLNGLNRRELSRHKTSELHDQSSDMQYLFGHRLQEDTQPANSNCFCPLTAIVNILPPSAEEVQGGLNRRLEEENLDLIVRDIGTVSAIDCDAEEETTTFESEFTFSFSAFSTVSDQEIAKLGAVIELVYNDLVEKYCDPLIRREANLRLTDRRRVIKPTSSISSRRNLQKQDTDATFEQEPPCVNFEATFKVEGLCRGCEDGTSLLDSQSTSRGLTSQVHDRILSSEGQPPQQRMRRRHLMGEEEECFCDSSTIAPRAPNIDELWLRLQPELETFVSICGQPLDCDPTAFVSQLTETTILALLLEPGTVISEVEILELEMTYMTAYNDFQRRLRVDKCGGRFRQLTSVEVDRSMLDGPTDLGDERVDPEIEGGRGRQLKVQSPSLHVTHHCTRKCGPRDDVDVLRAMIDPIKSLPFVREVLAINEFLTGAPSSSPSLQPSMAPSGSPSVSPSGSPSVSPSTSPSSSPSLAPSGQPSSYPSEFPSEYPSGYPSTSPSTVPSTSPSLVPSASPSTVPSTSPSLAPSASPSSVPSKPPSLTPSIMPSTVPSVSPSSLPSIFPSGPPSESPTVMPSLLPSMKPSGSALPSVFPSLEPSSSVVPSSSPPTISICSPVLCNELNDKLPDSITCSSATRRFCLCNSPTCPNCIGTDACIEVQVPIGPNSCLGDSSCPVIMGVVGENSCIGESACDGATFSVGDNSCNDLSACKVANVAIPDNACNDVNICAACQRGISPGQCNDVSDFSSCPCLPTFGAGSCVDIDGLSACYADGFAGDGITKSVIGANSCTGFNSCIILNNVTIGNDSCNAASACDFISGVTIGNNACNAESACGICKTDVGDNQCNEGDAECPCGPVA